MIKTILLLSICLLSLPSQGCYLLIQGTHLVSHQVRAERIERKLADPDISEQTEAFLLLVEDIREFASGDLGLEGTRNYTSYVRTDRDYLVAVVSATQELSFTDHTWWFPITGDVFYKGFFNPKGALREAARLENRGYDTWISKVTAFSSLGYFRTPLYSFMEDYAPSRLADLIIHEQTHETIWVKGQVAFNEELAVFVGNRGAELYIKERYGEDSQEYRDIFDLRHDREQFSLSVAELRGQLDALYRSPLSDDEKRLRKELTINRFQEQYAQTYHERFRTDRYLGFAQIPVNNAYISISSTYFSIRDIYERLYAHAGGDLTAFIDLLRPLDGSREDPYAFMEELLSGAS